MIVYNKFTGDIIARVSKSQNINTLYYHYPQEFRDSLDTIPDLGGMGNLKDYKVINGEIVKVGDTNGNN